MYLPLLLNALKTKNSDIINFVETDDYKISLRTDFIIHIHIKDEVVIDEKTQQSFIQAVVKLKNNINEKLPLIVEIDEFVTISENAISHTNFAFVDHVLCIAFYSKTLADRILAGFYTKKYDTSSPFVFFNDFEKAVAYCHENMKVNNILFENSLH